MKISLSSIIVFPCLLLILISTAFADQVDVEVSLDVPDPGWKLRIVDMYEKQGKLLIVCEAKHNGGINAQVISRARAVAAIDEKYAKLPREIYLLGCKWNWGKGYTAVTMKQLEKHTADAKMLHPVFVARKIQPEDFVGMEIAKAQVIADENKLRHRIIMVDGKPRPVTRDHRPERLNFTVEKGKVTKVTKG